MKDGQVPHSCRWGRGDCDRTSLSARERLGAGIIACSRRDSVRLVLSSLGGLRGIPLPSSSPAFPGTCPPLSGELSTRVWDLA